jgi:hypothetical protein
VNLNSMNLKVYPSKWALGLCSALALLLLLLKSGELSTAHEHDKQCNRSTTHCASLKCCQSVGCKHALLHSKQRVPLQHATSIQEML